MTTNDIMTLRAPLERSSDANLQHVMSGFTAERLMALEVDRFVAPRAASGRLTGSRIATATATGSGRHAPVRLS